MAAGVLRLLSDDDGRRAMGERARQAVLERYNVRRLVSNIDALYRSLLA